MVKWKIFSRKKSKDINTVSSEEQVKSIKTMRPRSYTETEQDAKETLNVEYHETLYSEGMTPKSHPLSSEEDSDSWKRRSWEDVGTIEKRIDKMHLTKGKKSDLESDVDRKIDRLVLKKKK